MTAGSLESMLSGQLADPDSHWGLGSFGAIAEFVRSPGEPVELAPLQAVTARGGIRIENCNGLRAVAFETAAGVAWNQTVALCLSESAAALNRRAVLTELGPDTGALRGEDRAGVLFDLGLAIPHVDACIRVKNIEVAAALRGHAGQNVFAPGNNAMHVIFKAQPHRVFVSRCARVEVYQPIPPHDGRSPEGPHTHVLPKLLAHGRTHAATEPIPDGQVPCLSFYPAHPVKDTLGRAKPFEAARHDAFQALLRRYGAPEMIALKQRVTAAVVSGELPPSTDHENRQARATIRVALRQLQASGTGSPSLARWLERYERPGAADQSDLSGCH